MTCATCGSPSAAAGGFCSRCGAPQPAAQPGAAPQPAPAGVPVTYGVPYIPRVPRHLQTLGVLWGIFAAYRVVSVFLGLAFANVMMRSHLFGWRSSMMQMPFLHAMMPFIFATTLVMAGAAALVCWGLLQRKPWARVLAIVFGVLALLKFPFGTALGIYTLWVLAPSASGVEYDAMAVE
ncbi:hypothetical protein [Terriglobus albidus]|uniref:hypothetical protein n=1 Tax=Terriglobus albidus TaxID=1592106 RepID=UPI0021DFCBCB|nr:hypothetical protein [Terriglobus albidus]